jgi:hypothetical protein
VFHLAPGFFAENPFSVLCGGEMITEGQWRDNQGSDNYAGERNENLGSGSLHGSAHKSPPIGILFLQTATQESTGQSRLRRKRN